MFIIHQTDMHLQYPNDLFREFPLSKFKQKKTAPTLKKESVLSIILQAKGYSAMTQPALPMDTLSQVLPLPPLPKVMVMRLAPSGTSTTTL